MTSNTIFDQALLQTLMQHFLEAEDRPALAALAEAKPDVTTDAFLAAVDNIIESALKMGEYDTAEALRQRVDAMKEIRAMQAYQRQDTLAQAVIAFVQAADETTARQTFNQQRALLDSDAALAMFTQRFDARDNKAHGHLRRRAQLLQQLRAQ